MPRDDGGKVANERPGQQVVDDALNWIAGHRTERMFLWVHLFEPHAPYGDAADGRPADARYDDEVAEADRQVGRLVAALGADRARTAIVVTSDHGEAFGEHGEIGHSVFVYDTTLRVPLVIAAPSLAPRVVTDDVTLVDVAPTLLGLVGVAGTRGDGTDLGGVMRGGALAPRALYAESFAPLLDFGWSPLRALRAGGLKYISAPRPELYDVGADASESVNIVVGAADRARPLAAQLERLSPASLDEAAPPDGEAARRLQALGYLSRAGPASGATRADPKDRVDMARRLAQVTSGELAGAALESTLRQILADEPANPQAHLRLGYLLAESARCGEAEPHFRAVIAAATPTADAHLGLAGCLAQRGASGDAAALLGQALALEPDNPVVVANQGVLLSDAGRPAQAVPLLRREVELDAGFLRARFALAVALARAGQRAEAELEARALLGRLPQAAPQRGEVERLLKALQ
jgi:Flp pilus assembly protein TadD